MDTKRYEPYLINDLSHINHLFSNLLQQQRSTDKSYVETGDWRPAVDIKELVDKFIIYADLPGVDKDKIDISMENNVLTIKGEREVAQKTEKENFSRIERITGSFYRQFTLPDTADNEQISAKTANGVLEITIPKKQKAQPRRIEIAVSE